MRFPQLIEFGRGDLLKPVTATRDEKCREAKFAREQYEKERIIIERIGLTKKK